MFSARGRLVEAGLTPADALRAATLNPARAFGWSERLGTVTRGKLADLVLLDADPLADIRATAKIRAVFANGRVLSRAVLDSMLATRRWKSGGVGALDAAPGTARSPWGQPA